MSEEDFVTAWLLAARASSQQTIFTNLAISQLIAQAREIYQSLYGDEDETNS